MSPGDDIQAVIDANPGGTTFCFGPGTYRLATALTLKSNDVLDGGGLQAVFDGSKDITSAFVPSGSVWVAGGQTQSLTYSGQCEAAKPLCQEADDVFFDGRPLTRVGSAAAVGPGDFYFDHTSGDIYIGDDPVGHLVEATVAVEAIHGYGTGVDSATIKGLVVQHFADHGIQCRDNWTVDSSEIRWNHGDGLQGCGTVVNSTLHDNGKDGFVFGGQIGSSEGPYNFSYNTVTGNNYAGFNPNWEAGGAKFMQMAHLTVSHNFVSGNDGNGLWTDWGNQFVTYDSNTVTDNTGSGIFHEASYDATISNNTITGNGGTTCTSTLCNSGIMMNDSQNVAIFGNTLSDNLNGIGMTQTDRGSTTLGPLVTQNVSVHDNTVTHSGRSGLVEWVNDGSYYTSRNNHFSVDAYNVCGDSTPFVWQDPSNPNLAAKIGWSQWQTDGNDTTGSYGCS